MTQEADTALTAFNSLIRTDNASVRCAGSALCYDTEIGEWIVTRFKDGHLQCLAETPLESSAVRALLQHEQQTPKHSVRAQLQTETVFEAVISAAAWVLYEERMLRASGSVLEVRLNQKVICITSDMEEALEALQTGKVYIKKKRKPYFKQKQEKAAQTEPQAVLHVQQI